MFTQRKKIVIDVTDSWPKVFSNVKLPREFYEKLHSLVCEYSYHGKDHSERV